MAAKTVPFQATPFQEFASAAFLTVQVIPSGDVITLFVPELAMAAKTVPFQATPFQEFACAAFLAVQVIPSVEVITRLVPLDDTATINPLAPTVIPFQFPTTPTLDVQVVPLGLVITVFVCVLSFATATKRESVEFHTIALPRKTFSLVLVVQVVPSTLVIK